ncbi:MAG: ester cyclase, partial [Candidatus Nanopelagicaceae bacterium]
DVEPSGKQVSIEGMTFFKFSNGIIVEAKVQNDVFGLMQQIDGIVITPSLKKNKEVVRRYYDVLLNQRDFKRFDEVASPNFIGHRGSQIVRGAEGLKLQMDMFVKAFPDIEYQIEEMIAEADKVAVRFRAPGTQKGEFAGIPPTGKQVVWQGNMIYRLEDGKVAELQAYLNDSDLISELQA